MSDTGAPDTPAETPAPAVADGSAEAPAEVVVKTPAADTADARIAKLEERYENVRSYADRTSGDNAKLREELARVQAKAELLESQSARGVTGHQAVAEQAEFDKQWKDRLAAKPEDAVDFVRGTVGELRQVLRDEVLAELRKEMGGVNAKLGELDPEYRSHKEQVDALMAEMPGLSRESAIKVVKKFAQPTAPAQPARAKSPAAVTPARVAAPAAPEPAALPPGYVEMARRLGLKDDHIKQIAVELAKDGRK